MAQAEVAKSTPAYPALALHTARLGFGAVGLVSQPLAAQLFLRWWLRPTRRARPEREELVLARGRPFKIPFHPEPLAAWSWGAGPTVLFVHGWEGRGSQFHAMIEALTDSGYRVVAFDAPAHGDTAGSTADFFAFAGAAEAALRHVGPVLAVVGHSMGCMASVYALRGGRAVGGLVAVSPGDPAEWIERAGDLLGFDDTLKAVVEGTLERHFGLGLRDLAAPTLVRSLVVPGLVVHDEHDRTAPLEEGMRIASGWPGARFVRTTGLGHNRILRDPSVVAEIVAFLDTCRPVVEGGPT